MRWRLQWVGGSVVDVSECDEEGGDGRCGCQQSTQQPAVVQPGALILRLCVHSGADQSKLCGERGRMRTALAVDAAHKWLIGGAGTQRWR